MDTNGSIRSSAKRGQSYRPSQVDPAVLESAKQFLESFSFDLRIRGFLQEEKLESFLSKYKYYVLGNEHRFDPGFLVIQKGSPIVFLNNRLQYGFSLRLRLHESLSSKGGIFIATLDTLNGVLRLEDVWLLSGSLLVQQTYTKRYEALQKFYATQFVQDTRLSGCTVTLAKPTALESLQSAIESGLYWSVDLIPDAPGKRRWIVPVHRKEEKQKEDPIFNEKGPEKTLVEAAILTPALAKEPVDQKYTYANAYKSMGLPDTYDLKTKDGVSLGKAAVQTANVSIQLRQEFLTKKVAFVPVAIQWYEEFERYKIASVLEN
jgi:hypothetical protein